MNPIDWIKVLLGKGIVEPIATYYTRKQELKAARFDAELKATQATGERVAQLRREGLTADATWELESLKAHADGWKDEFVLIVLSVPVVLCFIPGGDAFVQKGFAALAQTPWWYPTALLSVYLATYGIRWWRRSQSDT
jgi:hypothetical protein